MSEALMSPPRITVEELRRHWGEHLARVVSEKTALEVTRHGRPDVYLVPAALWRDMVDELRRPPRRRKSNALDPKQDRKAPEV